MARICAPSRLSRLGELKLLLKRAPFRLPFNDYAAGDGPAMFMDSRMSEDPILDRHHSA